jgi:hypothetical protein
VGSTDEKPERYSGGKSRQCQNSPQTIGATKVNNTLKYAAALAMALSCGTFRAEAKDFSFTIGSWVYQPLISLKGEPYSFSFLSGFLPEGEDPYIQTSCQGTSFKFNLISRRETSISEGSPIRIIITIDGSTKLYLYGKVLSNDYAVFSAPLTQDQIISIGTAKKTISVSVPDATELAVLTFPVWGTSAALSVLANMCAFGEHTYQ